MSYGFYEENEGKGEKLNSGHRKYGARESEKKKRLDEKIFRVCHTKNETVLWRFPMDKINFYRNAIDVPTAKVQGTICYWYVESKCLHCVGESVQLYPCIYLPGMKTCLKIWIFVEYRR